jgi:hypothetical protein
MLAVPLIAIVALFFVNLPIRTTLLSNADLLNPQWVSGYCEAANQSMFSCPLSVNDVNGAFIQISSIENISTALFQLYPTYASLISHSSLSYELGVDSKVQENVNFKFSQVLDTAYYSSMITNVSTSGFGDARRVSGLLSIDPTRQSLAMVLNNAARIEMNMRPPTHELLFALSLNSADNTTAGNLVVTSGLRLAGLFAILGVYYCIFQRNRPVRIVGIGMTTVGGMIGGDKLANQIYSIWPPFEPSFTWIFSLGIFSGLGVLILFFLAERSKT